jgi:hypothetical protein
MYVVPIQSILEKLPVVPVGDTGIPQFCTTCATSFRVRPAMAGRVPAMDAEFGLSTLGHFDGPVICNEIGRGASAYVLPHGERLHCIAVYYHIWGILLSTLWILCHY